MKRRTADAVVTENTVAATARLHAKRRIEAKLLEPGPLLRREAFHLLQLHAVIESEHPHRRPVAIDPRMPCGRPVQLLQFGIIAQIRPNHTALQEELQFLPTRIGRRTAVAADGKGTAGIGVFKRNRPVLSSHPASQQAGEEAVAGTKNIEHLDRKALAGLSLV